MEKMNDKSKSPDIKVVQLNNVRSPLEVLKEAPTFPTLEEEEDKLLKSMNIFGTKQADQIDLNHFEFVWEKGEEISSKVLNNREKIISFLQSKITEYSNIKENKLQDEIQKRKLGEILFGLTALSKLDNINTFEVLQKEILYQELSNKE